MTDYWRLLRDPKQQFTAVPNSRWRSDSFLSDNLRDPHSAYTDTMALVSDVASFDAEHYGIPPQRARFLDPQHRLLVDLARAAIQDAGWETAGFDRENTSVFMSLSESGYREISMMHLRTRQLTGGEFGAPAVDPAWEEATAAVRPLQGTALSGLLMNMGPSSISSTFDLHGESFALDAACSGGLAAVAQAIHALREGRCRIALAGGAQLVLTPDLLVGLCRIGVLSPTGDCRPFDVRANGFVLGEGAGVLALRPLADARAAGDRVYAVVRGVGLANDGAVKGNMMPQREGQLLALRRAYADAKLSPGAVDYIEAHGTGTTVGDQVEISALRDLRGDGASPAYLGAAKAVVGHSLGASGLAGLIKSVFAVHKGEIVPQPDLEPAGYLGIDAAGLSIPTTLVEWATPDGSPRRAGVSAFGFGGTNVHVVLEQAGHSEEASRAVSPSRAGESRPELLLLSARDKASLARHAKEVASVLADEAPLLNEVVDTLARRSLLTERLAVVADTTTDAVGKLITAATSLESGRTGQLAPSTVFGSVTPGAESTFEVSDLEELSAEERSETLAALANRAVSGSGLRLVTTAAPRTTLPPSPLSPRHHWILDEREFVESPNHSPRSSQARTHPQPRDEQERSDPQVDTAAPPVPDTPQASDPPRPRSIVFDEIARTSAFPVTHLRDNQDLLQDLGFDSLMLKELEANIRRRLPHCAVTVDPDGELTIDELIAAVDRNAPQRSVALRPDEPDTAGDIPGAPVASFVSMNEFPEVATLEKRLDEIENLGVPNPYFRTHEGNVGRTTTVGDREYLSFSSYNYLGLSGHPVVNQAVCDAVRRYGSSVSGSRLLVGHRPIIRDLERELANLVGTEDCVTLVSGHATNVTALGHVVGPDDLIVHDALAHDSILQGCALSGATRRPFAHNDLGHLEHILRQTRSRFRRVLLVAEGLYSMDGDLVDLPPLIDLKKRYGTLLMIDEAHSIGTMGDRGGGVGELYGVERSDVDLWMGTLSKSLASCGGYLAGSGRTIEWLRYTLPGFVYSAGMTPPNTAAALTALELIRAEPHRLADLRRNTELFARLAEEAGLVAGSAVHSPVVPCVVGDSAKTLRLANALFERGIVVDPILYPAVDDRQTRLRFFITSEHREDEIRYAVTALGEELASMRA